MSSKENYKYSSRKNIEIKNLKNGKKLWLDTGIYLYYLCSHIENFIRDVNSIEVLKKFELYKIVFQLSKV